MLLELAKASRSLLRRELGIRIVVNPNGVGYYVVYPNACENIARRL